MRFKRTLSDCKNCPLYDRNRVWSECDSEKPSIVLIGEAPGQHEDDEKKPFVGPAGNQLKKAIAESGILWHTTYRMNVICCRPPDNKIDSIEAQQAIECCKKGFEAELKSVRTAKVFIPLGNTAMEALHIKGKVSKSRGSVYETPFGIAVPTYHPSFILRGAFKEIPTWIADIKKARDLSLKKWNPPKENFNIFPKYADVKEFVERAINSKALVSVDIETTSLNADYAKILMVGLAINGSDAIVVPFTKKTEDKGVVPYWKLETEEKVKDLLRKLFKKARLMFQNSLFDAKILMTQGYEVNNIEEDTMLLHHAINPELPHNLGYIVSIYGITPYWKGVVLGSESKMINMNDDEVRPYNARDTVVLQQVLTSMLEDLREVGTENTYRNFSLKLVHPILSMMIRGVKVDQDTIDSFHRKVEREITKIEKILRTNFKLKNGFNLDSNQHVSYMLYGSMPSSVKKAREELKKYDENKKLSRTSKKYKGLVELTEAFTEVPSLYKTRSNASGTAKEDMISVRRAAYARLESIDGMVRQKPMHLQEKQQINALLKFIELYEQWGKWSKLRSTKIPVGKDGRVHGEYLIHGTSTGRLSSRNPNMQNYPPEAMDCFVAEEGYVLIKGDYSNLELRVLAYIAKEKYLIDAFKRGEKIHNVNTKLLFGVTPEHPDFEVYKRAAKTFAFGRNYGGGVEGIYRRILEKIPEFRMSFQEFKKADEEYFNKLPDYKKWKEETETRAKLTRMSENAFGRKRFFMEGTSEEIAREALNTPIQGTAADIANTALITLYENLKKANIDAHVVMQIHDALVVECPEEHKEATALIMKESMEQDFVINGMKAKFPVDFVCGRTWKELATLEV